MKKRNVLLSLFVSLVTLVATTGVGVASWWTYHQPELPERLKK
ncbi:cyclic lactone autoinducer peptide [Caldanaerobius polysaccharolyticus]|nr:cyclic lactone autoinducer peptide [Caldanaerobius polysaccharolyticus]